MANFPPLQQPQVLVGEVFSRVPEEHRRSQSTYAFVRHGNKGGVHSFLEGPVIVEGKLYMVDIAHGRIFAVDLSNNSWDVVIDYGGQPNGLAWHPVRKEILIADRKNGIMGLDPKTKELKTVLVTINGEWFKGPNDLVVAGDGSILFTDQGTTGLHDPTGRVYRHWPDTGRTDIIISNGPSPNGLLLNKEENLLFVGMTRDNSVWHVPLNADGNVTRAGRFSSYYGLGGPDGMTLDSEGNLFVCIVRLGHIFVHAPDGSPLARIIMPEGLGKSVTNLTWSVNEEGGEGEGKTLYITESDSGTVVKVDWNVKGWLGKIYYGS
ncbi:SMP-30/gluconolaconase/LRE-like region-containing protein [Rhizodiscina lignyota]|uniref:SMP-30/gluconolaconase/LRE-like region-containing protein n=1 Tax=Rhizodiscina lignyota TaxID=1504668 RepID=A0A9P4INB8_9PEZI|nr:SMP-30/gluconolaconase/LRE-like region-containing protein [Rhizodiscina lignyota]